MGFLIVSICLLYIAIFVEATVAYWAIRRANVSVMMTPNSCGLVSEDDMPLDVAIESLVLCNSNFDNERR